MRRRMRLIFRDEERPFTKTDKHIWESDKCRNLQEWKVELRARHSSVRRMDRNSSRFMCSALFHFQDWATFHAHRPGFTVVRMMASGL